MSFAFIIFLFSTNTPFPTAPFTPDFCQAAYSNIFRTWFSSDLLYNHLRTWSFNHEELISCLISSSVDFSNTVISIPFPYVASLLLISRILTYLSLVANLLCSAFDLLFFLNNSCKLILFVSCKLFLRFVAWGAFYFIQINFADFYCVKRISDSIFLSP